MFAKELQEQYNFTFLGFVDNFQQTHNAIKPENIAQEYDLILILSQNHGNTIYEDFSKKIPTQKLIKVEATSNTYRYLQEKEVLRTLANERNKKQKQKFLQIFTKVLDWVHYKRRKIIFISKGSITSNNKALFIHCYKEGLDVWILTDNKEQYKTLQELNIPVVSLESWNAYILIAQAQYTVQDQANLTQEINLLSPKQKSLQMWHGIPLKRLNKLTTVSYDYLISTSEFVNKTTLGKVIEAKEYKALGYPRNDLFLKEIHDNYDLLFCDKSIYAFAKNNFGTSHKIVLYMPTHRESTKAAKIPLDIHSLNTFLAKNSITLILKLHHFVLDLYKQKKTYSNIFFHTTQGDVYPLLKYTDILITDYSSVYFDFLLLNRPIVFFDYDKEEYEANMQGFLYEYDEFTPGLHVKTQHDLENVLEKMVLPNNDTFKKLRETLIPQLFKYSGLSSSNRICSTILDKLI